MEGTGFMTALIPT